MAAELRTAGKFGKLPPKDDLRTLRWAKYVLPTIATPPPLFNALNAFLQKLGLAPAQIAQVMPMDGNNELGDCTIAALAHATTLFRGLLGSRLVMTEAKVREIYFGLSGGQDTGLNELDVLNWWRQNQPSPGEQLLAFVSIDPKNHLHVQQAISTFNGVYIGFQVTQECQQQFAMHQPWTKGTLTEDGHAVYVPDYNTSGGSDILTWGGTQGWTWGWWDQCVQECYALVPIEARDPNYAPGFDVAALEADLAEVGNQPPVPAPVPAPPNPVPPPTPPPPPPPAPPAPPQPQPYPVGSMVTDAMADQNDTATCEELYFHGPHGTTISLTLGKEGLYFYSAQANQVGYIPWDTLYSALGDVVVGVPESAVGGAPESAL